MRTFVVFFCLFLIFYINLSAQDNKTIVVKAGTKVLDYFPVHERYRYQEFIQGQVVFKNGKSNNLKLNYNILLGEMEFIQSSDTLYIAKKKDIRFVVAQDTFYYDNAYIEVISGGQIKVGLNQYVKLKDVLKKGAYGTTSRSASIDTYNSMSAHGMSFDLIPNEDIELQKTLEFYLSTPSGGFVQFNKKNVIQLFPERADNIKAYIKSNKVDFDSRDDLLRFAEYLRSL
jgi:hypothetical protein